VRKIGTALRFVSHYFFPKEHFMFTTILRRTLLCLAALPCFAQTPTYELPKGYFTAGFALGGIRQTVSSDDGFKGILAGNIGYGVRRNLSVHLHISDAAVYTNDVYLNTVPYTFTAGISILTGEAQYEFRKPTHRLAPMLLGGFGGLKMRNIRDNATNSNFRAATYSDLNLRLGWQSAYTLGGGLNIALTPHWGFELAIRGTKGQYTQWFSNPTIGIYFRGNAQ
jgi:hypothetical protein